MISVYNIFSTGTGTSSASNDACSNASNASGLSDKSGTRTCSIAGTRSSFLVSNGFSNSTSSNISSDLMTSTISGFIETVASIAVVLVSMLVFSTHAGAQSVGDLDQVIHDMINEVSSENLTNHILILQDAGGTESRITFTPGVDHAANYVKEQFDAIDGLSSVEIDTFYISTAVNPYNQHPQVNVIATIIGDVYPEKSYVIGAHLDSTSDRDVNWGTTGANWEYIKAPGADDNATGVASILEIARILTDPQYNFRSDYTIKLVAFGAEERLPGVVYSGTGTASNHHGSIHYAERARENEEEIVGMVSIDMIGYNDENDYTAIVFDTQPGTLNADAVALGTEYYDANIEYAIGLIMNEPPFAVGSYSDHQSFADEGYPAILLIENAAPWNRNAYYEPNPYYHKSTDTYDKLNMNLVRKVTQLSLATLASTGKIVTSAGDERHAGIPSGYSLSQNYPNPFNPSTTIHYELPSAGFVSLEVYDMIGRKVATLVNEHVPAGRQTVTFDARNLTSGTYMYRLQTNEFQMTRMMMLVK